MVQEPILTPSQEMEPLRQTWQKSFEYVGQLMARIKTYEFMKPELMQMVLKSRFKKIYIDIEGFPRKFVQYFSNTNNIH